MIFSLIIWAEWPNNLLFFSFLFFLFSHLSLFQYSFLHNSFFHLFLSVWFLWVFVSLWSVWLLFEYNWSFERRNPEDTTITTTTMTTTTTPMTKEQKNWRKTCFFFFSDYPRYSSCYVILKSFLRPLLKTDQIFFVMLLN